jgi:hypothetical protein
MPQRHAPPSRRMNPPHPSAMPAPSAWPAWRPGPRVSRSCQVSACISELSPLFPHHGWLRPCQDRLPPRRAAGGLGLPVSLDTQRRRALSASAKGRLGHDVRRRSSNARRSRDWRRSFWRHHSHMAAIRLAQSSDGSQPSPHPRGNSGRASPSAAAPERAAAAAPEAAGAAGVAPRGGNGGSQPPAQVVQQVELSLKVTIAAGDVCAFHVGGGQETGFEDKEGLPVRLAQRLPSPAAGPVCPRCRHARCCLSSQRWEFFIGDRPQPEEDNTEGGAGPSAVPPIAQLRKAEQYAISGTPAQGQATCAALFHHTCKVSLPNWPAMLGLSVQARLCCHPRLPGSWLPSACSSRWAAATSACCSC